jgi:hypothetical protein
MIAPLPFRSGMMGAFRSPNSQQDRGAIAMPLADAFVSNDEAIKSITADTMPSQEFGGVDVKSLDVVKFTQLYAVMTGKAFKEALQEFLPEAHVVSDDGPWVYRCPAPLQAALAALHDPELSSTAEQWATKPEFKLDRIDASTVAAILGDLVALSQVAEGRGERLYLWNCL